MTELVASRRRQQADRELGRTRVGAGTAQLLTAGLLVTILSVSVVDEIGRGRSAERGEPRPARPLVGLARQLPAVFAQAEQQGFFAANRTLQREIDQAETALEDQSLLRAWLLPPVQTLLLGSVGLGNEQVYPGREGWLFYRPDLDHVTGPGFLEPAMLRARERGGDAWETPPEPDPLPAILGLRELLGREGIELALMPTPVKPTVEPERFSNRPSADSSRGVENTSYSSFLERLAAAGVSVFDPTGALVQASRQTPEGAYLRTDTHWSPAAMEIVAGQLAGWLTGRFGLEPGTTPLFERPASVEGRGDLFGMLRLSPDQSLISTERVETRPVLGATGAPWRPQPGAPVLLLGDSFTNVFSDARLGWGSAAGLAERLAFHLRSPVDRIALNAGGAHASREALARARAGTPDRLAGTRVVVYQFATRELSFGDWRTGSADAGSPAGSPEPTLERAPASR